MCDQSSGSLLNLLPPEVVGHVLQFLCPRDILNLAEADERIAAIVKSDVRVLRRLQFNWSFFVSLEDRPYCLTNKRLCDFNVLFATKTEEKLDTVMNLVESIPTGGRLFLRGSRLIVIIADPEDAQELYRLLRHRGEQCYLSFGYIPPPVSCKILSTKKRYVVILQNLDTNFRWSMMAAIVNVKGPSTIADFDELLTYLPRRVFQLVNASTDGYDLCKNYSADLKDAGPVEDRARLVNRQFHQNRRRDLNSPAFSAAARK